MYRLQVVGTSLDASSSPIDIVPFTAPTILVLGNEGSGVRPSLLRKCTHLVKIDGIECNSGSDEAFVDSLNVSVSGGILLYHILKGR